MHGNILKSHLEGITKDFLSGIYTKLGTCARRALETVFGAIVTEQSTLVTDLARGLRKNDKPAEAKRANEKVSGWLGRWDFVTPLNPWLLAAAREEASDEATYAVDFPDISNEFGGKGMEGMALGWDGSRWVTAMGHDFICVSLVGAKWREARPVYAELGKGRRSKGEMHKRATEAVMEATGKRGWQVEERGMDDAKHIVEAKRNGWKTVVRAKEMTRDVFGDGLDIGKSLAPLPCTDIRLRARRGDRCAQLRWKRGAVQHCAEPNSKTARAETAEVLVVESRFKDKSIWLYAICPDGMLSTPEGEHAVAARAAQAYCDRWQIETSFQTVKQEFALEKARVRTFRRLEDLFALCILAYVFVTDLLRKARGFETVSAKTHALLAGIRALVAESKIRFISGRPQKVPRENL